MLNVIEYFFGCSHKRCTFPLSSKPGQRRSGTAAVTGTYYVCLDCGKEFAYDWEAMGQVKSPRNMLRFVPKLWRRAS